MDYRPRPKLVDIKDRRLDVKFAYLLSHSSLFTVYIVQLQLLNPSKDEVNCLR